MCVACAEFIKDTLTLKEFQNALIEMTREDSAHLQDVERAMRATSGDPDKLREALAKI